jgi:hypothetical protein
MSLANTERYRKDAYRGQLDFSSKYAIKSIKQCAEDSLSGLPHELIGKFLYFYFKNPVMENPVTCRIGPDFGVIHPGQGRALGAFFRKDPSIDSLFVFLEWDLAVETRIMHETAHSLVKLKKPLFVYGPDVSTKAFGKYFYPPAEKNQAYIIKIAEALAEYLNPSQVSILWTFDYRSPIHLGLNPEPSIVIKCKSAIGLYESILHLTNAGPKTDNFEMVKY